MAQRKIYQAIGYDEMGVGKKDRIIADGPQEALEKLEDMGYVMKDMAVTVYETKLSVVYQSSFGEELYNPLKLQSATLKADSVFFRR